MFSKESMLIPPPHLRTILLTPLLVLITISSVLSIYVNKGPLITLVKKVVPSALYDQNMTSNDVYWTKEILKGGYILHFRHAERDKWLDVHMYDLLESKFHENGADGTAFGESQYYKQAVCLNDRGLTQARAMGEIITEVNLPVSLVVSSPSCRARQTADLVFGGYGSLDLLLLHEGVFRENIQEYRQKLQNLYQGFKIESGKNVVISAHNSVVNPEMFLNGADYPDDYFDIEEGGFYIISKNSGGIKLEYRFKNFHDFAKANFTR